MIDAHGSTQSNQSVKEQPLTQRGSQA